MMLANDELAGLLLAFFVGWHKHAKLPRKGEAGLWNAFSLPEILAGSGLTPKQWYRVKPLLEAYVRIVDGGYGGKRAIWTQPTALTTRFLAGTYPTNKAAREALALLKCNVKQVPHAPVDTAPGDNQGQNQGAESNTFYSNGVMTPTASSQRSTVGTKRWRQTTRIGRSP